MPVGNHIVQGLWIGDRLSPLERLSIRSFLAHGHEYHLYAYGPIAEVPDGTRLRDAREVLPESLIFQYRDFPSYAGFANYFRYKLLLERGGWWVDTDLVCLRPLDIPEALAFASEPRRGGGALPSAGAIKAPSGSEAMAFAWEECQNRDPARLHWGETGSRLLDQVIRRFALERFVLGSAVFSPIAYDDWHVVLDPDGGVEIPRESRAVHLWNEMWRRAGRSKDAAYPVGSLFERWKARYLGSPPAAGPSSCLHATAGASTP